MGKLRSTALIGVDLVEWRAAGKPSVVNLDELPGGMTSNNNSNEGKTASTGWGDVQTVAGVTTWMNPSDASRPGTPPIVVRGDGGSYTISSSSTAAAVASQNTSNSTKKAGKPAYLAKEV